MDTSKEKKPPRPQNKNLLPPIKKGECRNPNGRPKGAKTRSSLYRKVLEATLSKSYIDPKTGLEALTVEERMVLAQATKALKGEAFAFRELMDGTYGKIKDNIKLTTNLEGITDSLIDERIDAMTAKILSKLKK